MSTTEVRQNVKGPTGNWGEGKVTYGRNGVPISTRKTGTGGGYRTYEIHQRERVGESTEKIKPRELISPEYVCDPYRLLGVLRENYPCYRDWLNNCYWITRYNDATSIFADDANYETRPKRWSYGLDGFGRDLREELPVLFAQETIIDANARGIAEKVIGEMMAKGSADLATEFAARYPIELLCKVLGLPEADLGIFAERYWRMQRGTNWEPVAEQAGLQAIKELTDYFKPILEARRADPGDDMISAIAGLDLDGGPATAEDIVATILEGDHETLHGGLANLWFLLLTHPDQLAHIADERRLVKHAFLEALRHSAPVLSAKRFSLHEVERFGRLFPEGALVICSAAAGNRDPRAFKDPDKFIVGRKDLCQREPRGMYRADGLPAGIAFGMGKPSRHPAIPEDRPRSLYAITRDTATTASHAILDMLPNLRLQDGAEPYLTALRLGEMHTCWSLPVTFDKA